MNIQLMKGDCLKQLKKLKDNSVDSVVTDPPYGIGFMGKAWDTFDTKNVDKANKDATKSYKKTKDKKQDNPNLKGRKDAPIGGKATFAGTYDLSPKGTLQYQKFCEEWGRECLRVLKPGGHLLSSCSPRMYHRMTVGLEDAGFEIRDQIMWVYGSGFPKSHNIGKAVDKIQGNESKIKGYVPRYPEGTRGEKKTGDSSWFGGDGYDEQPGMKPVYKINNQYEGWGTALKPAHEPIVMARKPFKGSVAQNVLEYGTGGINIDECRIGYRDEADEKSSIPGSLNSNQKNSLFGMGEGHQHNTEGRFPANIILECTCDNPITKQNDKEPYNYKEKEYKVEGFITDVKPNSPSNYNDTKGGVIHTDPNCPCYILDEQSGNKTGQRGVVKGTEPSHSKKNSIYGDYSMVDGKYAEPIDGLGGASRFFYQPKTNKQFNKEKINKKHTKMTNIQLLKGDCIKKLKGLKDNSVDSVVTDPPYEIGFMGKGWDDSGIANNPKLWKEVLRVLKPGGHLLSFSHSRTYHRQAVAVEDAGFEIRDQIMWVYGSGFPKSHNIGKAVDKIQGTEREVVGDNPNHRENKQTDKTWEHQIHTADGKITKGNSQYEGWGTALKPAHEPIVMARKPFKGSVAQNVLEYGTGGINIDECRIGTEGGTTRSGQSDKVTETGKLTNSKSTNSLYRTGHDIVELNEGRFPANIIFDKEAGKILDEQSGVTKSSKRGAHNNKKTEHTNTYTPPQAMYSDENTYDDTGGASRFFYCPKASKKDRNDGCDELEEKQRPGQTDKGNYSSSVYCKDCGKTHNGINDHSNCSDEVEYRPSTTTTKNNHPTVKPTDLMAYLVRLVTPKGGTVLDPFMGSGSTGKASVREGMDFIGIEREDEYMEIAKSRIEHEQSKHNYRKFFDAV